MPRADITELELAQIRMKAERLIKTGEVWTLSKLDADRLIRLTGEVTELRNREAHTRQMHEIEGEY